MLVSQIQDLKENDHQQINQSTLPSQKISSLERLPTSGESYGYRAVWYTWYLQAGDKLIRDGAAIGDEFDQYMFLFSRLDSDDMKMVSTTARDLAKNRTDHGIAFLENLDTVFEDPNKKARAQQYLHNLKQKDKEPFAMFLPKFEIKLANSGWSAFADDQKLSL